MLGASHDPSEQRYQPYRYASDKPAEVEPTAAAQASADGFEYRTPCSDPKGQGESDLCAQWKAANAAADGALWTKWGVWIGCIGSALLLWQIILTRKAVEDTSEATEAMREANNIARDTMERQLRAYLNVTDISQQAPMTVGAVYKAIVSFHNKGQTPASNVKVRAFISRKVLPFPADDFPEMEIKDGESLVTVAPGEPVYSNPSFEHLVTAKEIEDFQRGRTAYYVYGNVTYLDVFANEWISSFRACLEPDGRYSLCDDGNHAT